MTHLQWIWKDPDPNFQVIPDQDPVPALKQCQIKIKQIFIFRERVQYDFHRFSKLFKEEVDHFKG